MRDHRKITLPIVFSLILMLPGMAGYATTPVNTINTGSLVKGGTYYNTPDGNTTFRNSQGGLWVQKGTTIRGLEVDASGGLTQNGGTLHFYAPNSVVRVDGTIDVNALSNRQGAFLGNGGKVFVDAAYLYQSGNIFANGQNGGLIQVNVGSMTLLPGGRIEARGVRGQGGVIAINAGDVVDLQPGSIVDSSGQVIGSFDRNLINIEGGLVNSEGILRADGIGSRGGTVRLVASGQSDIDNLDFALVSAQDNRNGQAPVLTLAQASALRARGQQLINRYDGTIRIGQLGRMSANGSAGAVASGNDLIADPTPRAGDGGTVILAAQTGLQNQGRIQANGGNGKSGDTPVAGGQGGSVTLLVNGNIANQGQIQSNGGQGGSYTRTMIAGDNGENFPVSDSPTGNHLERSTLADASNHAGMT